jgi:hypothetical protein
MNPEKRKSQLRSLPLNWYENQKDFVILLLAQLHYALLSGWHLFLWWKSRSFASTFQLILYAEHR